MKRKMRKNLILFLSILLFGTLLAACSSKEGSGDSPAAKENSESAADTDSSADSAEENGAEEESAAEAESRILHLTVQIIGKGEPAGRAHPLAWWRILLLSRR